MTDLLVADAPPWQAGKPGEILASSFTPVTGLTIYDGDTWLYHCLVGVDAPISVWAYTPLTGAEVAEVLACPTVDLDACVKRLLTNGTLTFAIAYEQRLNTWASHQAGDESPLTSASTFITHMQAGSQQ